MAATSDVQRCRDVLCRLAQYGTLNDADVAERLSTGLTGFLERWEREVLPFVGAGGAELRFLEGPNGRGKTHFLQAMEVVAQREGFATSRVECGMEHKPFASLQETYRAIASTMSTGSLVGNMSGTGLAGILAALPAERIAEFMKAPRGNPAFRNVVIGYAKRTQSGFHKDSVTQDLRALLHHDTNRRVTFQGLFSAANCLGVRLHRPMGKVGKRNVAVWLRSLLTLPRQLGFRGLVVLFDETGADVSMRSSSGSVWEQQQHLANLRNLVDHMATGETPGCSVVYATTRDLMEMAKQDYAALWQRVARLHEGSLFAPLPRNPRAIWCRLDELTEPAPDVPDFYLELGNKVLALGADAGVPAERLEAVRVQLLDLAKKMSESLAQAAVRDFVKRVASEIVRKN